MVKAVRLTLNDEFIDKIVNELNNMKEKNNKILKLASSDKEMVLVISHINNEMNKNGQKKWKIFR